MQFDDSGVGGCCQRQLPQELRARKFLRKWHGHSVEFHRVVLKLRYESFTAVKSWTSVFVYLMVKCFRCCHCREILNKCFLCLSFTQL